MKVKNQSNQAIEKSSDKKNLHAIVAEEREEQINGKELYQNTVWCLLVLRIHSVFHFFKLFMVKIWKDQKQPISCTQNPGGVYKYFFMLIRKRYL